MCQELFSTLETRWWIKGSSCLHAADFLVGRESRDKGINILASILSLLSLYTASIERAVHTACLYFHFLFRTGFLTLLPTQLQSSSTLRHLRQGHHQGSPFTCTSQGHFSVHSQLNSAATGISWNSLLLCSSSPSLANIPLWLLFLRFLFFSFALKMAVLLELYPSLSHSMCSPWTTASHAPGIYCQSCLLRNTECAASGQAFLKSSTHI